jgi:hypothetical protein
MNSRVDGPDTARVTLLIQQDLIEDFEVVPLQNFDKFTLQVHLNKLAKNRSSDRVLQIPTCSRKTLRAKCG